MSKKKRILKGAKKEKLAEKKEVIKAIKKAKEIVKSGVVNKSATDFSSLDFSCKQKSSEGHPWNLKIASWNIAGVRAWQKVFFGLLFHKLLLWIFHIILKLVHLFFSS